MVDLFTILLTHAVLGLAALRLVMRSDLDRESAVPQPDEIPAEFDPHA